MPNGDGGQMAKAQQQADAAYNLGAQQQSTGTQWLQAKPVKRDEYANQITIERREHDAVLRFKLQGEDYSTLVREITVPLGALEGLT